MEGEIGRLKTSITELGDEVASVSIKMGQALSGFKQYESALVELSLAQERANNIVGAFSDTNNLLKQVVQNNTQSMSNYDMMLQGLYHNLQDNNDTSAALAANFANVENALVKLTEITENFGGITTEVNIDTVGLTNTMERHNNTIVDLIQTMNNRLDTEKQQEKAIRKTTNAKKAADEWEKQYREGLEKTNDVQDSLNIRTKIYRRALRTLADEQGIADKNMASFNLGMKSFKAYTDAGGTSLEYFAKILTGTEENVKILGFEATSVRRVMYGFLPPGMFRLVNKTSTALNAIGGVMRTLRPESDETANMFTKMFGSMIPSQKDINRMKDRGKILVAERLAINEEIKKDQEKLKAYDRLQNTNNESRARAIRKRFNIDEDEDIEEQKAILERKISVKIEEGEAIDEEGKSLQNSIKKTQKGLFKYFVKFDLFNKRLKPLGNKSVMEFLKAGSKSKYGIVRFFSKIGIVLGFISKMLLYSILIVAAISGIVLFVKKNEKILSNAFNTVVKVAQYGFELIFNGVGQYIDGVMNFFNGLMEGDFQKTIDGLKDMAMGALSIVGGILITVVGGLLGFIGALAVEYSQKFLDWWSSVPLEEGLATIVGVGLGILAAVALIALLPVQVPIWLGLGIVLLGGLLGRVFTEPIQGLIVEIRNVLGKLPSAEKAKEKTRDLLNKIPGIDMKANGGFSSGGLTIVGERGPELVNLPAGSRVHSNPESRKIVSKGETVFNNTINVNLNIKDTSDAELKKIAEKVGRMFSTRINRSINSSLMR